jgi:5-methylcytosine-specific restriction enzyme A
MKISCPYCGGMHERGAVCPKKPKRRYRYEDREAYKVHRSNRWTELSLDVRKRDAFLCVYCLRHDNHLNNQGIEVHHIRPIKDNSDRAYDRSNLISLCREHHEQAEKGLIDVASLERMVEQQENGEPLGT